jgi:hypothetical protein
MLRQHLLVLTSQLLGHPLVHYPFVRRRLRVKSAARRNAMSDFSRDVKPDNNRWRFAAKPAHLAAPNPNSSPPSRIRFKDGCGSKEQE